MLPSHPISINPIISMNNRQYNFWYINFGCILFSPLDFHLSIWDNHELPSTHIFQLAIFKYNLKPFFPHLSTGASHHFLPWGYTSPPTCLLLYLLTLDFTMNTNPIFFLTHFSFLFSLVIVLAGYLMVILGLGLLK